MTDISQLSLQEPDPVEWGEYQVGGVPIAPPPAGTYTGSAPDKIDFTATNAGKLMAIVDPIKIIGPTNAGEEIRFTRVSTARYKNRNGSPAGDYLKACGVNPTGPLTNEDYVNLFESTAGRPFQFDLDWEAYDKEDGFSLEGMENFPDDGKGGKSFYVVNPSTGNKLRARARVRRFRPAV